MINFTCEYEFSIDKSPLLSRTIKYTNSDTQILKRVAFVVGNRLLRLSLLGIH